MLNMCRRAIGARLLAATMGARMHNCTRPGWLGLTICGCACLALQLAGCGGAKPPAGADAAAAGTAPRPEAGAAAAEGAAGGSAAAGAGGSQNAAGALAEDPGVSTTPEKLFEGVPFDVIKGTAPVGCVGKTVAGPDTLVLTLDSKVSALRLTSRDGKIIANGVICPVAASVHMIKITGGTIAETVIIDGSQGDFPAAFLGAEASIVIDLAAGKDTVAVMGTLDNDRIGLGSMEAKTLLQSSGKLPKLSIVNNETLIVSTGPGDDRIEAGGSLTLGSSLAVPLKAYAGDGDDTLSGGAKDDELHAGTGEDTFETAAKADGADIYDGGPDIDSLSYALRTAPLIVRLNDMADDGEPNERDNVQSSVENLIGGSGADTLTGNGADNILIGGPGNDTLYGGAGDDTFAEATVQAGTDIMNGGSGSDTVDYSGRTADITITLCVAAPPTCAAGACGCLANDGEVDENDTLISVENATTGSGNDTLTGTTGGNYFNAGAGDDILRGADGEDNLYGEAGNDTLEGGPGDDLLDGSGGLDTFEGGDGDGDICVLQVPETQTGCELH
jgi:Ca2+-binding RTX toxin-like protein